MIHAGQLGEDKAARYEKRNNLYCYLGQKGFHLFVSRKIKLLEGDILTLYTRGIWEYVDEGELLDVFSEAGNEPKKEGKQKRLMTAEIAVLLFLFIVGLLLFFWQKGRREKREEMELIFANVETYMEDNNYIRAREECKKGLELAESLRDKEKRENNRL